MGKVYLLDVDGNLLKVDPSTKILLNMDYPMNRLHEGHSYVASHLFSTVADGNIVYMRIVPHATTHAHFGYVIMSDGACKIEVLEGTTYTNPGGAVILYNRDRNSANGSDQLVYQSPVINVAGTVISVNLTGADKPFIAGGSVVSHDWHLKPSVDILLKVTNTSGDASEIIIKFNILEEL